MYLFENGKTGPEILQSCEIRTEDGVIANGKIQMVKNVEFLYIQKTHWQHSYDSINICIHFV